ncbi:DNA hydrolase, partial [Streptomyces goshikiensis]
MPDRRRRDRESSVYRQADDYDRGMSPYDPSAFPPFAVTVDLVVGPARGPPRRAPGVRRGDQ